MEAAIERLPVPDHCEGKAQGVWSPSHQLRYHNNTTTEPPATEQSNTQYIPTHNTVKACMV